MHLEPIRVTIEKLIDSKQTSFFQFIWWWTAIKEIELHVLNILPQRKENRQPMHEIKLNK